MKALLLMVVLVGITGCGVSHAPDKSNFAQAKATTDPVVVFMGDSITENWGIIGDIFQTHPAYIDAGISGNDSGQMVDRFATDVVAKHPTQVVILAGTNDAYPWYMQDNNWNTANNITYMVAVAKANDIVPILATIPPWGCGAANCGLALKADPETANHYKNTAAINAWIVQFGAQQSLIVLDFHSKLVSADGNSYQPNMTIDGIHPSAAGYALMNPMVEDAISANQWK